MLVVYKIVVAAAPRRGRRRMRTRQPRTRQPRTRRARDWWVNALVLILGMGLAGCSASSGAHGGSASRPPRSGSGLERFYFQHLHWSRCGHPFECARLRVPLDYTNPEGRSIELAVIRAPARDRDQRIGSLITNPGGPGASGVEFVRHSYSTRSGERSGFDSALRTRFDVVGFDPRGVGRSAPIRCLSNKGLDEYFALDTAPTSPAHIAALVAGVQRFDAGCQARSGKLLAFVGTPNAARDIDVLRAALGDEKLNYLGYSYGTYLGAVYAQLFPARVGRMVLDGPLPPELSSQQGDLAQAHGFQTELDQFIADCVTHRDCPLGADPNRAAQRLANFFTSTQAVPLPTGGARELTGSLAKTAVSSALYDSPTSWPELRTALSRGINGNGHQLLGLADQYNERDPDTGAYANTTAANTAINCLDHPDPVTSPSDVIAQLPSYQRESPLLGSFFAWAGLSCAYWPVPSQTHPHPISYAGSPPIVVLGTTGDPATPYSGARDMAHQLGSAVLLTLIGQGHTAYGRDSACIDTAVDTYLTHGTPPPLGTVCRSEPHPPN